jgi:ATP-binding cassette subfamily C (CFTR/MRP) protein 1
MKAIKLSGLVDSMAFLLQSERVRELKLARNYRALNVWVQVVVQTPTIFGALVVFAAYAVQAKVQGTPSFSTAQAFTSLAIISLLTMPAAILLMTIPMVAAGYGCVKRIEAFLNSDDFEDQRDMARGKDSRPSSSEKHHGDMDDQDTSSFESESIALSATKLVFGPSAEKSGEPVTFQSKTGSLTTVLGPVGCGKSTFLRTILNEIKPTSGKISISTPYVGYCAQTPWLPNAIVRDIITGPNKFDEPWYKSIVETCALEEDFKQMPNNDLTLIGSRGIVLSGGQKHRIVSRTCPMDELVLTKFCRRVSLEHYTRAARSLYLMIF